MRLSPETISQIRERINIVEIISEVVPLKKAGREYKGLCPFHNEQTPSFTVDPEKKMWKCFGCGNGGDAFSFVQQQKQVSFSDAAGELARRTNVSLPGGPQRPSKWSPEGLKFICEYIYTDWLGNPLHRKKRFIDESTGKKTFLQSYFKNGLWTNQKPHDQRMVLYRLVDLLPVCSRNGVVYLCEGEKDADNLRGLGLPATTMVEGADKTWLQDYTDSFRGAKCVVILQDNDEIGARHANKVASILTGAGLTVRVLSFPQKDVSDWLAAGGTKERLVQMVSDAEVWAPQPYVAPGGIAATVPAEESIYFEDKGIVDSDMANAKRFAHYYGKQFHHTKERGWLAWNESHWQPDQKGTAVECAKDVVRKISDEISAAPYHYRPLLEKHARKAQSNGALHSMLKTASTVEPITADFTDFDGPGTLMKLNVKNGTIDLETGKLKEHDRADKFTRVLDIVYDAWAKCPMWLSHLEFIFGDDQELISYLQRFFGYMLTGRTGEHKMLYFHGGGANGKSVTVRVLQGILGPYGLTTPASTFVQTMQQGIPNDLARMQGARLVVASELSGKQHLDESLLKYCTGGDKISARFLRQEFFEFTPQFKLIMTGNYMPKISGDDYAMFRRVHMIPFLVQIPEKKREELDNLVAKLLTEKEGILAWMLAGCIEWQEQKLCPPESVTSATEKWFLRRDFLRLFIQHCCNLAPEGVPADTRSIPAKDLYSAYKEYCKENGFFALNAASFQEALQKKGLNQDIIKVTCDGEELELLCYIGIDLKRRSK